MKRTRVPTGYTIAEVMIVLAVTGALFVSAMGLINGQQGRTQFTQNAREVETNIRDVMNDVSTGYYPNIKSLSCSNTGGVPTIVNNPAPGTDILGTNQACIYVGQALQFTATTYIRHSIVGLRRDPATGLESANIVDAKIRSATPQNALDLATPDATQTFNIPAGMRVDYIRYNNTQNVGTIAFIGEFAGLDSTNLLQSKAGKQVDLVPVKTTQLTDSLQSTANKIGTLTTAQVVAKEIVDKNPSTGVSICLTNDSQQAIILIGGDDLSSGTSLLISQGNCS